MRECVHASAALSHSRTLAPSHFPMPPLAVILAAGQSKRMASDLPKPLHEVCGRPMLAYILDACFEAGCRRVIVVVGHGREKVEAAFGGDDRITFVEQAERRGTGHAVQVCVPEFAGHDGDVFILAGDLPLVRGEVLARIRRAHRESKAAATMGTAVVADPFGYGRVIRGDDGEFVDIVEQADATAEQRLVREVFPSFYCVRAGDLIDGLSRLTDDNAQGEYYLTDLFGILRRLGRTVTAVEAVPAEDVIAPNTRAQLADADAAMQRRIVGALRESGVTVTNDTVYVEHGTTVGRDTILRPFTFVGRGATIGRDCEVGPFARVARDAVIPDGTTYTGGL